MSLAIQSLARLNSTVNIHCKNKGPRKNRALFSRFLMIPRETAIPRSSQSFFQATKKVSDVIQWTKAVLLCLKGGLKLHWCMWFLNCSILPNTTKRHLLNYIVIRFRNTICMIHSRWFCCVSTSINFLLKFTVTNCNVFLSMVQSRNHKLAVINSNRNSSILSLGGRGGGHLYCWCKTLRGDTRKHYKYIHIAACIRT